MVLFSQDDFLKLPGKPNMWVNQKISRQLYCLCFGHFSPPFPFLARWFAHLFWQLMDSLLNWFNSLTQLRTILIDADRQQLNGFMKRTYEEWVCKVSTRNAQCPGHSPTLWTAAKLLHCLNTPDIFTVTHSTWSRGNTATSQAANFSISLLMLMSVLRI